MLELIKKTGAVRKFRNKDIPNSKVDKILKAGIWSFSVLGIQPWHFICIRNKIAINKIANLLYKKVSLVPRPLGIIVKLTAKTINNSNLLIAIYNNAAISLRLKKYGHRYVKRGYIAELQSIGGAIQNMYLEASSLGLGCVWVDSPTFFEKDINTILGEKKELVAFLVLGYSAEHARRSRRITNIASVKRI